MSVPDNEWHPGIDGITVHGDPGSAPGLVDSDEPPVDKKKWLKIGGILLAIAAILAVVFSFSGSASVAGSVIMDEYESIPLGSKMINGQKIPDYRMRNQRVLEAVKADNMASNELVTVELKWKSGSIVKFKVQAHELRLGTDDDWVAIPIDGPYARATCELQGLTLMTKWMTEQTRAQAFKSGGKVFFFNGGVIAKELGTTILSSKKTFWGKAIQDGDKMKSPPIIRKRNELLVEWLDENGIKDDQLVTGHFKEIIRGQSKGLAMYPGYQPKKKIKKDWRTNKTDRLTANGHGTYYHDYSHHVRCGEDEIEVNGDSMTVVEFYSSAKLRTEFGLGHKSLREPSYEYYPHLKDWLAGKGQSTQSVMPKDKVSKGKKSKDDGKWVKWGGR